MIEVDSRWTAMVLLVGLVWPAAAGCSKKKEKPGEPAAEENKPTKLKTFGRPMRPDHPPSSPYHPDNLGKTPAPRPEAGARPDTAPRDGIPPLAGTGVVEGTSDTVPVLTPGKPIKAKEYVLKMIAPAKIPVGKEAVFQLDLKPLGAYKTNKLYPFKVKLDKPPAGATFPKTLYKKKDAAVFKPRKVLYKIKVKAVTAGSKRITGLYKFSVCTPKFCELPKAKLQWTVEAGKGGSSGGRKPGRKPGRKRRRGRKGK